MNEPNELKTAWEEFYAKVQEFMTKQEASLAEREGVINRKIAQGKLIKEESDKLDIKRKEIDFDKALMEKEKIALREKQKELEVAKEKIRLKQEQIQRALQQ